tara:strand:- start:156 stop:746 length:591 start_codon:yes stop_codon:yes gene_type:complete
MSGILKVGGSELINDNGGSGSLQWGSSVPSGTVLQVKHGIYKGIANASGVTPALIDSSLSISITPNHASNKILILVSVTMIPQTNSHCGVLLYKNSSELTGAKNSNPDSKSDTVHYFLSTGYHSAAGTISHQQTMIDTLAGSYEDTAGSTNATTYGVYARAREASHYYNINRTQTDSDDNAISRATSSITVMEIKV